MARKGERARPAAVHLVLGEDSYLAEEALERILDQVIGAERADALSVIQGDESRWEQVIGAARTGSLFAARRAIVVRRAELLRYEGAAREAAEDPVVRYLDDPSPDATLILLAGKPDRRRNPWKRLAAEGTVHSAEPKKGPALRAYVEQDLRRRGLRLAPDGFKDLLDEVGQDLRRLMGEVDKLEAWAAPGAGTLSADDVHAVLGRGLGRPLYLLADAVAGRDLPTSLERLEQLLAGGEEGLRILVTVHRSIRQVRAASAMARARWPRSRIAEALLPANMQWKLDGLLDAARRWDEADLRRALVSIERADARMKRGSDAASTLVAALVEACGSREAAAISTRRAR